MPEIVVEPARNFKRVLQQSIDTESYGAAGGMRFNMDVARILSDSLFENDFLQTNNRSVVRIGIDRRRPLPHDIREVRYPQPAG